MKTSPITIVFTIFVTSAFWYFQPLRHNPDQPVSNRSGSFPAQAPQSSTAQESETEAPGCNQGLPQANGSIRSVTGRATNKQTQSTAEPVFDFSRIPGESLLEKLKNSTAEPCLCPSASLLTEYFNNQPGTQETKIANLVSFMVETQSYDLWYSLKEYASAEQITRLLIDNYPLVTDENGQQMFLSNLNSMIYEVQMQNPDLVIMDPVAEFLADAIRNTTSSALLGQMLTSYKAVAAPEKMQTLVDEMMQSGSDQALEAVLANFYFADSNVKFDNSVMEDLIMPRLMKEIAQQGMAVADPSQGNNQQITDSDGVTTGEEEEPAQYDYTARETYPLLNNLVYNQMSEEAQRRVLQALKSNEPSINIYQRGDLAYGQADTFGNWQDLNVTLQSSSTGEFRSQIYYDRIMAENDLLKKLVIIQRAPPEVIDRLKREGVLGRVLAEAEAMKTSWPVELHYLTIEPYQETGYSQYYGYSNAQDAQTDYGQDQ